MSLFIRGLEKGVGRDEEEALFICFKALALFSTQ